MTPRASSGKRLLISLAVFFGIFSVTATPAYADLTSIIGAIGPIAGAGISCAIKNPGGLQNIFGSGNGGDSSGNDTSSSDTSSIGKGSTNDGSLDKNPTTDQQTTLGGTSSVGPDATTGPSANPGQDNGPLINSDENAGPSASYQGDPNDTTDTGSSSTDTGALSVPVTDSSVSKNTSDVKTQVTATNKKLTCTNAIEKAAAQVILKELTQKTLNWVNGGFMGWDKTGKNTQGQSSYIKDTGTFLKNIANQTIGDFATAIGCTGKKGADLDRCVESFPFGKLVAQQLITSSKSYFEQNAKSSMNSVLAENYPDIQPQVLGYKSFVDAYAHEFGVGGWNAFISSSLTNNNPYGFSMRAQDELSNRLADTNYSQAQDIKDQLARNQGFLDLKRCVNSVFISDVGPDGQPIGKRCTLWETATPGSIVVNQLNTALGSTFRQLEIGQDLSTDITAVFNALLNQVVQKGLSSVDVSKTNQITSTNNQSYVPNVVLDSGDGTSNYLNSGNAFQTNIFDLSPTGIDPSDTSSNDKKRENLIALITREKQFVPNAQRDDDAIAEKLGWQIGGTEETTWIATMTKVDSHYTNLFGRQVNLAKRLIPAIYELDYCVPGPHPGWQSESAAQLQNQLNLWPKSTDNTGGTLGSIGKFLDQSGLIFNFAVTETQDARNEKMYSYIVNGALTMGAYNGAQSPVNVSRDEHVNGYDHVVNAMTTLYQRYVNYMSLVYTTTNLTTPSSADYLYQITDTNFIHKATKPTNNESGPSIDPATIAEDSAEWNNLTTYQKGIVANTNSITTTNTLIDQLTRLGQRIDRLQKNTDNLAGYPSPAPKTYDDYQALLSEIAQKPNTTTLTPYQRELRKINDTFNLIAPDLHSQEDVAKQEATLDNVTNRLEDLAGTGGYIAQCMNVVLDPKYTGLNQRLAFPPNLAPYLPQDFLAKFSNAPGSVPASPLASFLPRHIWSWGTSYPENDISIAAADVITIDKEPLTNALAGFESFLNMY